MLSKNVTKIVTELLSIRQNSSDGRSTILTLCNIMLNITDWGKKFKPMIGVRCSVNQAIRSHKVFINLLLCPLGSRRAVLHSASDKKWHLRARTLALYFADEVP